MGRPAKDLTGKQIGYWTIVCREGSTTTGKIQPLWKVRCVCGTEKILDSGTLRINGSRSCGCKTKELYRQAVIDDLTGRVFGRLTVIGLDQDSTSRELRWVCRCTCGTEKSISRSNLVKGTIISCGCYKKEITDKNRFKDESNKVYGRLTVIERAYKNEKDEWYWHCICSCGNETCVKGSHLRSGEIQSCGCLADEMRLKAITTHGLTHTAEYKRIQGRKRNQKEKYLDTDWDVEKEVFLRMIFPKCVVCDITEQEHLEKYGTSLQLDHIRPLTKGFGLSVSNATILCQHHNRFKSDKNMEDLPEDMWIKILQASELFQHEWEVSQQHKAMHEALLLEEEIFNNLWQKYENAAEAEKRYWQGLSKEY